MELVIDLSHHNTIPQSLVSAKDNGVRGVIHKATESITFVDSKVKARHYLTKSAGLLWGMYHFLRPKQIKEQGDHFLKIAEPMMDDMTLLACDYEVNGSLKIDDVEEFMEYVSERSGRSLVLYSGHTIKEAAADEPNHKLGQYRLWIAQYGASVKLPVGWTEYYLWQYTDRGSIEGISGSVDMNRFDGTLDELKESWSGRYSSAIPTDPKEIEVKIRITVPDGVKVSIEYE